MFGKIKKSAILIMSVISIGSTTLPVQALTETYEVSAAIINSEDEIMPMTASISLSSASTVKSITISWLRPSGAVKYIVTCGSQSRTLTTSSVRPSTTFTGLTSKTSYPITVKAYNSSGTLIAFGSTTVSTK